MALSCLAFILALGASAVAAGAPSSEASPAVTESEQAAFGRLRAEGVAAFRAGDLDLASDRLAQADERISNHPGIMRLRARVEAARGDATAALAQLDRYARAGLILDVEAEPVLAATRDQPGHPEIMARLQHNRAAVGADRLSVLATVPGAGLVESVARDAGNERWLVSRVAGRDILGIDEDGRITTVLAPSDEIEGVLGLTVDVQTGQVWAVTSPAPPATQGRASSGSAALLVIDVNDGAVNGSYALPPADRPRGAGDVLRTVDGDVYVSDGMTGEVFRLPAGGQALEAFIAPGVLASPQGMVETPDGHGLIIADYSSGLWRVSREGGAPQRMAAPPDAVLIGVDGLISDGRVIYALQNGVAPQRVLRLVPDASWRRIETVEVIAANLPELDEPTTGTLVEGRLVFVARSQWSDFDAEGILKSPEPMAAIIARLQLD